MTFYSYLPSERGPPRDPPCLLVRCARTLLDRNYRRDFFTFSLYWYPLKHSHPLGIADFISTSISLSELS